MKVVILAAGYATRLYPLTKNFPKPLLKVGTQTIMDHIATKLDRISVIDTLYIVTNHKFYTHFIKWASTSNYHFKIEILDDLTTDNSNRLGALKDLALTVSTYHINEETMVLAGDNIFDFELIDFAHFYDEIGTDVITAHILEDEAALKRTGVIEMDTYHKVINFVEKPSSPPSHFAVPPFYIYTKETITHRLSQYLDEGNVGDAPGSFIPWLLKHAPVYAYLFDGMRYDIGTLESYKEVNALMNGGKIFSY